jgi:hypothetical protein
VEVVEMRKNMENVLELEAWQTSQFDSLVTLIDHNLAL